MAHAQKPDFVFRRNGRVHLNRQGRQFSRLLAAEVCASAVVMLGTPCSEVVWKVLVTQSIRQFPPSLPLHASPCAITFQLDSAQKTRPRPPIYSTQLSGRDLHLKKKICLCKYEIHYKMDVRQNNIYTSLCITIYLYFICRFGMILRKILPAFTSRSRHLLFLFLYKHVLFVIILPILDILLLGIAKLDKEKNQCIRQKTGAQNIVQEIRQYQKKWLHVQRIDTDCQNKHCNINQKTKEHRTTEEEMEGPTSSSESRNRKHA